MKRTLKLPRHFPIQPSSDVALQGVECLKVRDRVPLYVVDGGNEPVFRLELMFRAGKLYEAKRNAASASANLMMEGTRDMTAAVLSEALEYYGATVRAYSNPDTLSISVSAMQRFSAPVLGIVREVLLHPAYTEEELALYQRKKTQRYRLSHMQNEYLANRVFSEYVFGPDHPYGYTSTPEDFGALTRDDLRTHHALLGTACLDVFLAGDIGSNLIPEVQHLIEALPDGIKPDFHGDPPTQAVGKWHLPGPQDHQASIRIGHQLISRGHEDYPGLFLLNTILGGYHGSRLVRNLREARGLTYSIQSNLESLLQSTCFVVTTDANSASRKIVVKEIYKEIGKLRVKEVETAELEMVRNYVCGNFLMQIDGPLNVVDTIKPLVLHNLPLSYFEEFLAQLRSISAREVQDLAQHYLDPAGMTEVVVGND